MREQVRRRMAFAAAGLDLCLSPERIERELIRSTNDHLTKDELRNTVILNARALIEKDADFAKFAGRILLSYIYEEALGWDIMGDEGLVTAHRRAFKEYLHHGISIGRLSSKLLQYDLEKLAAALDPGSDLEFEFLGIQTLYDRYLIIDKTGDKHRRIEPPQFFWMRVAMGLFTEEKADKEAWVIRLYNLYKSRRFCSSTPTLFNSGTPHSQLSSCYLYKVDDNIESIMERGIAENAYLAKWAGGLGGSWTQVRGTGSHINGTNGESQGVIPFLKIHNDLLVAVNQGGKRRGSGCAYLEIWHNDIKDFLDLRVNTGDERRRAHDMNTADWVPDLFMKRMEARGKWTLFRSSDVPDLHEIYGKQFEDRYVRYEKMAEDGLIWGETMEAIDLWKLMLKALFETGHPWINYKDPCNVRNPQDHVGVIHSSNLCTEITLNTSDQETAVCNLGSLMLDTHIVDGELNLPMLAETVTVAVRALDNVIDVNFYPTEAAKRANSQHRPVGLGVMGLHAALLKQNILFNSEEGLEFNDYFMEAIAYHAYSASSDLAAERGTYKSYRGSKWDRGLLPQDTVDLLEEERGMKIDVPRGHRLDWAPVRAKIRRQGMRNSNVLAIAPTATIANIMGTTPCIEPVYKNVFTKANIGGDFVVLNPYLVRDLKGENLWNEDLAAAIKGLDGDLTDLDIPEWIKVRHETVFSVGYESIINAAARRAKWIDQSQSLNLYLESPDLKLLSHMYRKVWHTGLKTTYYLRTLQASKIEKSTVAVKKEVGGLAGRDALPSILPDVPEVQPQHYPEPQVFAEAQAQCSIEAMRNGYECEACQ